jgi:hypothetical protein
MRSFDDGQIPTLTKAIVQGYPTVLGQAQIKMILRSLSIDFDARAVPNSTFELTLNDILLNLNQAGDLDRLFAGLRADPRPAVTAAVAALLAAPPPQQPAGFEELSKTLLIIEGDPFINHDDLATTILPSLLDRTSPLRAVVMTGPTDSGKTFSLGLIRRLCREAPPVKRFRPIAIDLTALALTRDCLEVARTVGSWLRLDQFVLPRVDTSETRIGQRLVAELTVARELSENIVPTLLVFDHLDKDVAPSIIDFVEELALAAANGGLRDVRVVLIGFPRAPATTFPPGRLLSDTVVQPNPALLFQYIDRALDILDRDMDDHALDKLVQGVFAGQQQPYPRRFMLGLPEGIRGILHDLIRAPTT